MESLSIDAAFLWQLRHFVLMELFMPVRAIIEKHEPIVAATNALAPIFAIDSVSSQHLFGSKNPKPRAKTSARPAKSKTENKAQRGAVLIVDDVPDVTEMIGLLLKHAGYEVSTADSAKSALRLARKRNYDLVISDIGMPEMNGYELAEALRGLNEYTNTPLIAVTGYSEYDDRGRAVRAGFDIHLTKPIEPAQLLDLMNELLSRGQSGPVH
jgi:CheY-like chemotaxis protein